MNLLPDSSMLITAGVGTAIIIGFGLADSDKVLQVFGAMTAEEILRKRLTPFIQSKLTRNDLLTSAPITVRQPNSAIVKSRHSSTGLMMPGLFGMR